jgi:Fe-S cluster assembly protein SufD
MIDVEEFRGHFESLEESSSVKEYRAKLLAELPPKIELPSYRYSSFVNMRLPAFDVTHIPVSSNAIISVDAKNSTVSHQLTDDHITRIVSQFQPESTIDVFHDAFRNSVLVVEIPEQTQDDVKIVIDVHEEIPIQSIYVFAGKQSQSTITVQRSGSSQFVSSRFYVIAEDAAHVEFIGVQNYHQQTVALEKCVILGSNDVHVKITELCLGSLYAKYDSYARLNGQGGNAETVVLYLTKDNQKHNIHTESEHTAQSTYSDIVTKGVITDTAKALCTGNVCIREHAGNSNGYETQSALLMSEKAESDAIPNLEIHNHDVKCSHGSTVGQLDKEQLFYFKSRGIPELKAKELIVQGYFNPVLEKLHNEQITQMVYTAIMETIHGKND